MRIDQNLIRASERRAAALPDEAVIAARYPLSPELPHRSDRRIQMRTAFLAADGTTPSPTELERIMGENDLVDEFFLMRALAAAGPVCRIVIRSRAGRQLGFATGFMISPSVMLTNHHVFPDAVAAENGVAEFNYRLDMAGNPEESHAYLIRPDLFFKSDRALDFAFVAVDRQPLEGARDRHDFGYHKLWPMAGKIDKGEWMTIIQHPGGERRQFAVRENQLVEILPQFLWYMSDTAKGSSGSPVFNDSFQLVALHHSGKARQDARGRYRLRDGTYVDSLANVDDSAVDWFANEGVRVSVICRRLSELADPADPLYAEILQSMETGDVMSKAYRGHLPQERMNPHIGPQAGAQGIMVPLWLNVSLGGLPGMPAGAPPWMPAPPAHALPQAPVLPQARPALGGAVNAAANAAAAEAYKEPIVDRHYANRKGYLENFLGNTLKVPLPKVTPAAVAQKLEDGGHLIPYQHFSVVLHKARRLALYTAANVDWRKSMRTPDPDRPYGRDPLGGFGKNDDEKWVQDDRIPPGACLPDLFYKKDGTAFDKGHLVRRDDVCWGKTYEELQRANGDTYHTTNCSPQVADFNRSGSGGIWGKLENEIQRQGKQEKYCLFSGPVLDDDDRVFDGVDDVGPVTIKVPSRYWKLLVAREGNELAAFAFILEQDAEAVTRPDEFTVGSAWRDHQVSVADLEAAVRFLKFPRVIHDADRYGIEVEPEELATAATAVPRRRLATPAPEPAMAAARRRPAERAVRRAPGRKRPRK